MYIKNGNAKYGCSDFSGKASDEAVLFYLSSEPKFSEDEIGLYAENGFLLRTVKRSDYKYETISEFGSEFILTLSNFKETEIDINNVKSEKIKNLSAETQRRIEKGFDMNISNSQLHFSCEAHDQRNIMAMCQYLTENADISSYLYHADGEKCEAFSRADIFKIRDAMLQHISELTEKYSELKSEVYEAKTVDEVDKIHF